MNPSAWLPDDLHARPTAGAVVEAVVVGAAAVAGSFLLTGPTDDFVAIPINAVVVNYMPDAVLAFSILYLGKLGELIGFALAVAIVMALFGGAVLAAGRTFDHPAKVGAVTALLCAVIAFILTGVRDPALAAGGAAGLVAGALEYHDRPGLDRGSRRKTLTALAGALGFAGISYWVGNRAHGTVTRDLVEAMDWDADRKTRVRGEIQNRLAEAEAASLDVEGLQNLVSPIEEFYEVDINYLDPRIDATGWELSITGAVENEFTLIYDEIVGMEPEHRFVTLRCVSDPLDGDLIDTALWTGISIDPLVERAKPEEDTNFVVLRAQDGYYAEFPLEAIEGGFLAYGMNGSLLPADHGYPLRALILGHWGEVNVKWITEIEFTESRVLSYWEKRGWQGTGPVNTIAKINTVNKFDDRVQIAGHAYAGIDGIQAVEISTDGGETWSEVTLGEPLPGRDTWQQWVYEWSSPPSGRHRVVARAIDRNGNVQTEEKQLPQPSGATGWVSETIRVV